MYDLRKSRTNFLSQLNPTVYQTFEMQRNFRNLSEYKNFKASEYRILCLYLAAIILPDYWDEVPDRRARNSDSAGSGIDPLAQNPREMLLSTLLLSCAINLLSHKVNISFCFFFTKIGTSFSATE